MGSLGFFSRVYWGFSRGFYFLVLRTSGDFICLGLTILGLLVIIFYFFGVS